MEVSWRWQLDIAKVPAKPLSNWVTLCKCVRHWRLGLLCVNEDVCVNSPRVIPRVKADDACKAIAWWPAWSNYSTDDNCDDEENDDNIVTLETQSPKTWALVYSWQIDLISDAIFCGVEQDSETAYGLSERTRKSVRDICLMRERIKGDGAISDVSLLP